VLKAAILDAVREEVRSVLREQPTPQSVLSDMGYLLSKMPPADALTFAKIAYAPLADFIDAATPADEPEPETTGAEGTGEEEE
jgi:hypothetical protein